MTSLGQRPTTPRRTWETAARARMLGCAAVVFGAYLASNAPSGLYPLYVRDLGLGETAQASVFASYVVGILPVLLIGLTGALRISTRTITAAALMIAAGVVLISTADSVSDLLLARVVQGAGVALASVTAVGEILEIGARYRIALARTVAGLVHTVGAAVAPILGGTAIALGLPPLQSPYLLAGSLSLAGLVLALATTSVARRAGSLPVTAPPQEADDAVAPVAATAPVSDGFVTFVVAITWCGMGIVHSALPRTVQAGHPNLGLLALGAVVTVVLAVGCVVQSLVGRIRWAVLLPLAIGGTLVGGCLTVTGLVLGDLPLVLVGSLTSGAGNGAGNALGLSMLSQQQGRRAVGLARYYLACYAALALGPLGVGLAAGAMGLVPAVTVGQGVLTVAAAVALVLYALALAAKRSASSQAGEPARSRAGM